MNPRMFPRGIILVARGLRQWDPSTTLLILLVSEVLSGLV